MEHRQVEPLFVLLTLLALVACTSGLVTASERVLAAVSPGPTPTIAASIAPAILDEPDESLPAECVAQGADTQSYVNVEDGYCLRYPAGFRLGEELPGIANFYGPPRTPGVEPLAAGLVVRVEDVSGAATLAEVAEQYVREQQRVGWLTAYTQTRTEVGGQPAVLLEGAGEYTPLYILLTVHEGKRYTLSIWPDPEQYPVVASDVEALRQTVLGSFSFLSQDESDLERLAQQASMPRP
jgi:hypothetical protein